MIDEVPIDDTPEETTVPESVVVVKKRGRPKGAPNKPKVVPIPKPPKAAKKQVQAPIEEEEEPVKAKRRRVKAPSPSDSEQEEPAPRKQGQSRHRAISPAPLDTRQVASEVLQLLSNRHVNQATARREKYRSWFPAV